LNARPRSLPQFQLLQVQFQRLAKLRLRRCLRVALGDAQTQQRQSSSIHPSFSIATQLTPSTTRQHIQLPLERLRRAIRYKRSLVLAQRAIGEESELKTIFSDDEETNKKSNELVSAGIGQTSGSKIG